MVPRGANQPLNPLRAVTQRLTSTPTKQLPQVVQYLANTVSTCGDILSAPENQGHTKDGSEAAILVHKYKTQISTLLQDKSKESRWASIVLIKATVEVGGWEVLRGTGAWVRGLFGILGKPDPPTTKKLCIILLTKIFLLTHDHQTLVREITTPSLPTFINSCLNLDSRRASTHDGREPNIHSPLLPIALEALIELLPHHPTSFRPFVAQIRDLILPLIAPTPSSLLSEHSSESPDIEYEAPADSVIVDGQRLFVLLHYCAPKNTASEEWRKSLRTVIDTVHRTADQVFRAIFEDWESSSDRPSTNVANSKPFQAILSDDGNNPMALPSWTGVYAGVERLTGLLDAVQVFIAMPTSSSVILPVGIIVDMISRMLSILPPSKAGANGHDNWPRINPEIGRDEREGLFAGLPRIHVSALEIFLLMISRLGKAFAPLCYGVFDQLLWVFQAERVDDDIRNSSYRVVKQMLCLFGPSLPRSMSTQLSTLIKSCCNDLLPSPKIQESTIPASASTTQKATSNGGSSNNADSYLKSSSKDVAVPRTATDVQAAAAALLPLTLSKIPHGHLSDSLRSQIDRTAILTQNREAMLASIMNPAAKRKGAKASNSIMPFLARSFSDTLEVEALIRPRMPILQPRRNENGEIVSDEEEEEEDGLEPGQDSGSGEDAGAKVNSLELNANDYEPSRRSALEPVAEIPANEEAQISSHVDLSALHNPNKRTLDNATSDAPQIPLHLPTTTPVQTLDPQTPSPAPKRPRLDSPPNTAPSILSSQPLPTTHPNPPSQTKNLPSPPNEKTAPSSSTELPSPAVAETTSAAVAISVIDPLDSDDEEFVVPTIDLESDTDEGEDGDEVEDED